MTRPTLTLDDYNTDHFVCGEYVVRVYQIASGKHIGRWFGTARGKTTFNDPGIVTDDFETKEEAADSAWDRLIDIVRPVVEQDGWCLLKPAPKVAT